MKSVICFFIVLFCVCSVKAQNVAEIRGTIDNQNIKQIGLYKVVDGKIQLHGQYSVEADGTFLIEYTPKYDGFYVLGNPEQNMMIYLKKGERLQLQVHKNMNLELTGKNGKENEALFKWYTHADSIRRKCEFWMEIENNSTYEDFFPQLERFLKGLPAFRKTLRTGNKEFDDLLDRTIDYDIDNWVIRYLQTPRSKHPKMAEYPAYYFEIFNEDNAVDHRLLQLPYGQALLLFYKIMAIRLADQQEDVTPKMMEFIKDSRCREIYVINEVLTPCKEYDKFQNLMKMYGGVLKSQDLKAQAEKMGIELKKKCGMAADFTYPDINGKQVSLSDFKGKVVLIDVWATWCGPCQAEVPHLLKLEESMKELDVVFMGVSIDGEATKGQWKECVIDNKLKGIQLLAGDDKKIVEDYDVKSIPRFIVIGKDGSIVAWNAPRPSNPALAQLLLETLNK